MHSEAKRPPLKLVKDGEAKPLPPVHLRALSTRWVAVPDTARSASVELASKARSVEITFSRMTTPEGRKKALRDLSRISELVEIVARNV